MIDAAIYTTYALILIAILIILIFAVARMVKHPGGAKSALVGIGGLLVLLLLGYTLSTGSDFMMYDTTENTSQWVGTGLIILYILGALTILSIIFTEVTRLFK